MFKRLLVSIEITRPHNMLVAAFGVAAGYILSGGNSVAEMWPAALITAAVTGAGNIVNDCYDLQIDTVNKPRRPLPSGRLTYRAAAWLYGVCTAVITAGSFFFLPSKVALLVVSWQLALYLYARWAKRMFVVGNLLVAAVTSSVFLAGALLTGNAAAAAVPGRGDGSVMEECSKLVVLELGEAIAACRSGAIPDMKTEIGLLRLADHLGYLPQLGCFVDELPPEFAARHTPLGVSGCSAGSKRLKHPPR